MVSPRRTGADEVAPSHKQMAHVLSVLRGLALYTASRYIKELVGANSRSTTMRSRDVVSAVLPEAGRILILTERRECWWATGLPESSVRFHIFISFYIYIYIWESLAMEDP